MKKTKLIFILLMLAVMLFSFCACSKENGAVDSSPYSPSVGNSNKSYESDGASGSQTSGILSTSSDRKLIYYIDMQYDVEDAAKAVETVTAEVAAQNGFVESSSLSGSDNKYARLVIRIPVAKVDAFLNGIAVIGETVNKSVSSEDVTAQLETIDEKLAVLNNQLTFYRDIDTTGYSLADKMTVFDKITSLEAQIETYEDRRSALNARVDYTTVTISIRQDYVPEENDESFGAKLWRNLKESVASIGDVIKFIVNVVVVILPYAIILGVIVVVIILIRKKTGRHGRKRNVKADVPEAHPSDEENKL